MNCEEVQQAIWFGEVDEQMEEHMRTCASCKSERQSITGFSQHILDMSVPPLSRRLVPDAKVIRKAIRRYRMNRYYRIAPIGGVIAAGVAFATVYMPAHFDRQSKGDSIESKARVGNSTTAHDKMTSDEIDQKQKDDKKTPSSAARTMSTESKEGTAKSTVAQDKATTSGATPQNQEADNMKASIAGRTMQVQLVTVNPDFEKTVPQPSILDAVARYLNGHTDPQLIQKIVIESLFTDNHQDQTDVATGNMVLTVVHQPGQSSEYGTGTVKVDWYFKVVQQNSFWVVEGISSTSFPNTGETAVEQAQKANQSLTGVLTEVFSDSQTVDGQQITTIRGFRMKITSNDSKLPNDLYKPGTEVFVRAGGEGLVIPAGSKIDIATNTKVRVNLIQQTPPSGQGKELGLQGFNDYFYQKSDGQWYDMQGNSVKFGK